MSGETAPVDTGVDARAKRGRPGDPAPRWMRTTAILLVVGVLITAALTFYANVRIRQSAARDPRVAYLAGTLAHDPDNVGTRIQLALLYQYSGYPDLALREYDRVLSKDPKDVTALYNIGAVRAAQGDARGAEKAYREALRIAPTHAYAAAALGFYLEQEGRVDEIANVIGPAVEAQPNVADLQYLAGVSAQVAGERATALAHYERALELWPGMRAAKRAIGELESQE